jgi:PDDEXK-like domain of unknown function (DUF3799)
MPPQFRIERDLHFDDYWADRAVSSSTLKKFLQLPTPAHVKHAIDNPSSDSEALLLGRLVHCLLLEADRLDAYFVIERERLRDKTKLAKNGGSKEEWDALKAKADARLLPIVPFDLWQKAQAMARNIEGLDLWTPISKDGHKELSVFTEIRGQPVKARYDILYGDTIFDIKSSRHTLTDEHISKVIEAERYHLSAAMYLDVGNAAGLRVKRFVWIFVENFAPYLCRIKEATPAMLQAGQKEFLHCLGKYKTGVDAGHWPGYDEDSSYIDLSPYYKGV